jgi:(p)ppGpp synthase/HD superfamily hydrolase
MTPNLESAIALAAMAHSGQTDKGGAPYILHPLRVMLAVPPAPVLQMAAVLHDVVEDNPFFTLERLWIDGYPREVVDALDALTKRRDEDYGVFIERCALNSAARIVKRYDLEDNMNLNRLNRVSQADIERDKRYKRAHNFIMSGAWRSEKDRIKPIYPRYDAGSLTWAL